MSVTNKARCTFHRCDWRGDNSEILLALNPFDSTDQIQGCPSCKDINCLRSVCDEPGCWEFVSMGTPTADGYRNTCHKHAPKG